MTHGRHQIRNAVVTALTGLPVIGNNVFASRVDMLSDKHLPCICVYSKEEKSKRISKDNLQERRLNLAIEVVLKADTDFDNQLDHIITDLEAALFNDIALKSLILDLDLSETTMSTGNNGELILGIASLNFNCVYHTREGTPQTII